MRSTSVIVLLASAVCSSVAAIKTSIYINEIPGYSQLPSCAEDRLSAIVRAQSSGCGDDQQLTSFSCFCIDQSSMISSILSTAVEQKCAPTNAFTTPLPAVTQAIEVFNSYCAKSTELVWYQSNSTATSTPSITPPPSSLPSASTVPASSSASPSSPASSSKNTVPVAAIAAPVVIGVLAIAGVVGLLFWMRRRRTAKSNPYVTSQPEQGIPTESQNHGHAELSGYEMLPEMQGSSVKYHHEMEVRPAELEGSRKG